MSEEKKISDLEIRTPFYVDYRNSIYYEVIEGNQYTNSGGGIRIWLDISLTEKSYSLEEIEDETIIGIYSAEKKDGSGIRYKLLNGHTVRPEMIKYLRNYGKKISFTEAINDSNLGKFQELVCNFEEEILLSSEESLLLQDFSKINFKIRKPKDSNYQKILELIDELALTEEQDKLIPTNLELERLLDGEPLEKEGKHGVILYGPPGTGKTTTMNAFFEIYKELGYKVHSVKADKLVSNATVGGFAKEISKQIFEPAIKIIRDNKVPCLIYVDEATTLVSKRRESNVSDWYQEGLDTIKAFLNRSKFPGVVLCIASNAELSDLDKTLVGEDGRLQAVFFNFLNKEQFITLWKDKLKKNLKLDDESMFSKEEISKLAEVCSDSVSGRFVSNFCVDYRGQYLMPKEFFKGRIKLRWKNKRNLTQESNLKKIRFNVFYKHFLIRYKKKINDDEKSEIEKINKEHYFTVQEKEDKIKQAENKYSSKSSLIKLELENLDLNSVEDEETTLIETVKENINRLISFGSDGKRYVGDNLSSDGNIYLRMILGSLIDLKEKIDEINKYFNENQSGIQNASNHLNTKLLTSHLDVSIQKITNCLDSIKITNEDFNFLSTEFKEITSIVGNSLK